MGSLKENIKEKGHIDQQRYVLVIDAVKNKGTSLKILELGCDDGSFAYGFAQLDNKVIAIDLDCSKAINIHQHKNIEYVEKNIEDMNYFKEFDVIHAGEILEHVENPDKLMELICRSLKKNGLIMISVPNFKHPQHLRTYTRYSFEKLLKKHYIKGTIVTIKHNLVRKKRSTERYAIYDGRISENQETRKISKIAVLIRKYLNQFKKILRKNIK